MQWNSYGSRYRLPTSEPPQIPLFTLSSFLHTSRDPKCQETRKNASAGRCREDCCKIDFESQRESRGISTVPVPNRCLEGTDTNSKLLNTLANMHVYSPKQRGRVITGRIGIRGHPSPPLPKTRTRLLDLLGASHKIHQPQNEGKSAKAAVQHLAVGIVSVQLTAISTKDIR